jgi:phage terminase large subunit-like protein
VKYSVRVQKIIRFIECLKVPSGEGEGKKFKLMDFQKDFINAVYGPVDENGKRIVRRAILSCGRKNGKTMMLSCLALVHLWGPEKVMNSECYVCANDREQASVLFRYCAQIVRADPELMAAIKIVDSTKTMIAMDTGSFFRAVSAEAGTKFGYNPVFVAFDELAQAKDRQLYDAFDTAFGARQEPIFYVISTQSPDPNHPLSVLIDDGLKGDDPSIVCHLKSVPEDTPNVFTDPEVWKLANPALGVFRSLTEITAAGKQAERMPSHESKFRNYYLNQRIDSQSPLIPRSEWEGCKGDATIEQGEEIYLGLDLSGTTDLTALVAVSAGEKNRVDAWFWKPKDTLLEHEARDRVPYPVWVKQGLLETTPGKSIEMDWIAARIYQIISDYKVVGMAYDRYAMKHLLSAFKRLGIDFYNDPHDDARDGALRIVDWGQGTRGMNGAIVATETAILNRNFTHDGNPILTWCFANAMSVMDRAGWRTLDKSKSRFRIDGAVACCMAMGLKYQDMADAPQESAYLGLSQSDIIARMAF